MRGRDAGALAASRPGRGGRDIRQAPDRLAGARGRDARDIIGRRARASRARAGPSPPPRAAARPPRRAPSACTVSAIWVRSRWKRSSASVDAQRRPRAETGVAHRLAERPARHALDRRSRARDRASGNSSWLGSSPNALRAPSGGIDDFDQALAADIQAEAGLVERPVGRRLGPRFESDDAVAARPGRAERDRGRRRRSSRSIGRVGDDAPKGEARRGAS